MNRLLSCSCLSAAFFLCAGLSFARRLAAAARALKEVLMEAADETTCSASLNLVALLLGVCLCISTVAPVYGAVIYSQTTPSQPTGAFSSNDAGGPTDQKVADNFLFSGPGPVTIRSLRFIGGYGLRNPPPPSTPPLNGLPDDDFRVVFFADSAGAPGLPLPSADFHVGLAARRTPPGGPLLNGLYRNKRCQNYLIDTGFAAL
jgi:hypothetical protein